MTDASESSAHAPYWQTIRLEARCANLLCENKPGEGTFTLLVEERRNLAVPADTKIRPFGPPVVLYVCSPCAAVLRGELT